MTKKQFLGSISFLLIVAIMVFGLCDLFEMENTSNYNKRYYTYRDFPEDTVDAVLLGTSGIDRYWVPSQAYEEYGITVYPLSTDAFPAWLYEYAVEEALKYQDVDLFILDIRPFTMANLDKGGMDVRSRRFLDVLPQFSINRIKGCFKTMAIRDDVDSSASRLDLSYLFPIIKFHSKWSDKKYLIENNWSNYPHEYLGFNIMDRVTARPTPQKYRPYDAELLYDLDPYIQECLYDFLDYLKEKELNVVFVDTPQIRYDDETGRSNMVYKILEEEGFDCVHFYEENDVNNFTIDLDLKTDFYNAGHANFYGATKFTDVFAKYLVENYDLKDRRNDEHVKEHWDGVHDTLLAKIGELEEARRLKEEEEAAELAEALEKAKAEEAAKAEENNNNVDAVTPPEVAAAQ
jgi:hypothetical protein